MAVSTKLDFGEIGSLNLDPMNPRLGRHRMSRHTRPESILELMFAWKLDELARSYLESGGFWSHEPIIVVREPLYRRKNALVVIEGNRRVAALNFLCNAINGNPRSRQWSEMIEGAIVPDKLFTHVPYLIADDRSDVQAFLGFRNVAGIKQWAAEEKAGFISQLVDQSNLTYEQVARKTGSTIPTVRRHYVAYQLLLQMELVIDDLPHGRTENRFHLLYEAIQKVGVQQYLNLDLGAEPSSGKAGLNNADLARSTNFARWLYGTTTIPPLVWDSRQISDLGTVLASPRAVKYLEKATQPKLHIALELACGPQSELARRLSLACDHIEEALRSVHLFKCNHNLQKVVERLGADSFQLLATFPVVRKRLEDEGRD